MKKLNHLIAKGKKMVYWNRLSVVLFIIGLLSLIITVVLTIRTGQPFFLLSGILLIPMFVCGEIYDRIIIQILDQILKIFKARLKWAINNDDIYNATYTHIEDDGISKYKVVVECPQNHITDICILIKEITTDFNNNLPPKFRLSHVVKLKLE